MTIDFDLPITAEDELEMMDELGDMEGISGIPEVLDGLLGDPLLAPAADPSVHLELNRRAGGDALTRRASRPAPAARPRPAGGARARFLRRRSSAGAQASRAT
ncbi:MAG: hypothetical protein QM767_29210 [Anaeromyxobacter sp.]